MFNNKQKINEKTLLGIDQAKAEWFVFLIEIALLLVEDITTRTTLTTDEAIDFIALSLQKHCKKKMKG